jgi:tetratricopeptide (TPR) repeat protein
MSPSESQRFDIPIPATGRTAGIRLPLSPGEGMGVEKPLVDLSRLAGRFRDMAREREELPLLVARFEELPVEQRAERVPADPELLTWTFCEWLIERGRELACSDAARAEETASLASAISDRLDSQLYGAALVQDLRARARICLGDALRHRSDLRAADEALSFAESFLDDGTGDTLEAGYLLEVRAALRRDQRRLPEAHRFIDEAIAVYRRYREFHLLGRAFVEKGKIHATAHDLETAIQWLRKGLGLLDPVRERLLELSARHLLMLYLLESGRAQEAGFLLKASRSEFEAHAGDLLRLRVRWLEGKILQALGEVAAAERELVTARRGFVEQGAGFDAAAVSLDLAGLFAVQGRAGEMRLLAEEMLPIFQARDLHREAIAALIVFRQAVRMERVSESLLREIQLYLERARKDHRLRFEPDTE